MINKNLFIIIFITTNIFCMQQQSPIEMKTIVRSLEKECPRANKLFKLLVENCIPAEPNNFKYYVPSTDVEVKECIKKHFEEFLKNCKEEAKSKN